MPFVKVPGFAGKVYVPDENPENLKKHSCRDCYACQTCSDDRCEVCRGDKPCGKEKLQRKERHKR